MWIRCSAWPALQAATAPLVIAMLVGTLFIGPQAITLSELGELFEAHSELRVATLLLWSLAMAPAARLALLAPGLRYLRWLPVSPTWPILHFTMVVVLLHAPPGVLVLAAGKPAIAGALLLGGVGLTGCLLLPNYRRWQSLLTLFLAAGILWAATQDSLWPLSGLGLLGGVAQLPRAWRRAAMISRRHHRALYGPAAVVLPLVQLLHLWRRESALLLRCALLLLMGAGLVMLISNANLSDGLDALAIPLLVAATPGLAAIAMTLAIALRNGEEELRWLSLSSGVGRAQVGIANLFLLFVLCALVSLVFVAMASRVTGASFVDASPLLLYLLGHALFWTFASLLLVRRFQGQTEDDSRAAAIALCLAFADMLVVGMAGPWALVVELSLVLLLLPGFLSSGLRRLRRA
jgi:hypothetical protein